MSKAPSVVLGVFAQSNQLGVAINALLQAGFSEEQIYFAGDPLTTTGSFVRLQSLFSRQQLPRGGDAEDLVRLGVPPAQAQFCYQAFEVGHSIVAVLATEREERAAELLRQAGGSVVQPVGG
jgi:hypothetical protein